MANKKIDQNFDKMVKEHVCKNQRRSICLSLRDGEAVLCGEENSVDLVLENLESMTVGELIEAMKCPCNICPSDICPYQDYLSC